MLHRILELVKTKPWLITASAHAAIADFIHARMAGDAPARDAQGVCGESVEVPQMRVVDEFCVIPINGVIAKGATPIQRGQGVVSCEDVSREIDYALANADVSAIILDVDSPGGMVQGTPELGEEIKAANEQKPVYAFTSGQMCSAAYWLSASSSGIFVTPTAEVGSIGVLLPVIDQVKRFEMLGYKVDVIKAGKYKGSGMPGTSLTEDSRDLLQKQVNAIHADFKAHVTQFRPVEDALMQGQTFSGKEATSNGLADGFARNLSDVMKYHREQTKGKQ